MTSIEIKSKDIKRFEKLIEAKTGIALRDGDSDKLGGALKSCMKSSGLSDAGTFYKALTSRSSESCMEWKRLASLLTTGESYFFRDRGQFALLKNFILPEIISRHRDDRSIRIWSAGCAAGQEPYSIAILLDELLPDRADWDILILGTDIDDEALRKARNGYYTDWSFRGRAHVSKGAFFQSHKKGWRVKSGIREMVTFSNHNILTGSFPDYSCGIYRFDLILCRNVFIYFRAEAVSRALSSLISVLTENGYLMAGHAELLYHDLKGLRKEIFPESVIYRKGAGRDHLKPVSEEVLKREGALQERFGDKEKRVRKSVYRESVTTGKGRTEPRSKEEMLDRAERLYGEGSYADVIEMLEPFVRGRSDSVAAFNLLSRSYANRGMYEEALKRCVSALSIAPYSVETYLLMAQIAELNGDNEKAIEMMQKTIYLDPLFITGYLELAILYEGEEKYERAEKMRETALKLLAELPPGDRMEYYGSITVGEIMLHLKRMAGDQAEGRD